MKRLVSASRIAVLAFASAISILPAAASALPKYDRVVSYYDEEGRTVGVRITNCLGSSNLMGYETPIAVHVTSRCDPEYLDPCSNWPDPSIISGWHPCPF